MLFQLWLQELFVDKCMINKEILFLFECQDIIFHLPSQCLVLPQNYAQYHQWQKPEEYCYGGNDKCFGMKLASEKKGKVSEIQMEFLMAYLTYKHFQLIHCLFCIVLHV